MRDSIKVVIVFLVVAVIGAGVTIYNHMSNKVTMNNGKVNGNTVGNLYGDGLFCQYNDKVYFAHPLDSNKLYVMNLDESDCKKLLDEKVYYINTDGNYIYYCRDRYEQESIMPFLSGNQNSLCRCKMDGKKVTVLDDALCTYAALAGNTIYYFHYDVANASTLYSIGIDGKDAKMISKDQIDPRCVYQDSLYYAGVVSDHYLHRMNAMGDSIVYGGGMIWNPIISGNNLFAMDLENKNRLARINIMDQSKMLITEEGVTNYNVRGNYIVYQTYGTNNDGIYVANMTDGTNTMILPGQYKNINMTDRFVYFQDYSSNTMYHSTYAGAVNANMFMPTVEIKKK